MPTDFAHRDGLIGSIGQAICETVEFIPDVTVFRACRPAANSAAHEKGSPSIEGLPAYIQRLQASFCGANYSAGAAAGGAATGASAAGAGVSTGASVPGSASPQPIWMNSRLLNIIPIENFFISCLQQVYGLKEFTLDPSPDQQRIVADNLSGRNRKALRRSRRQQFSVRWKTAPKTAEARISAIPAFYALLRSAVKNLPATPCRKRTQPSAICESGNPRLKDFGRR